MNQTAKSNSAPHHGLHDRSVFVDALGFHQIGPRGLSDEPLCLDPGNPEVG